MFLHLGINVTFCMLRKHNLQKKASDFLWKHFVSSANILCSLISNILSADIAAAIFCSQTNCYCKITLLNHCFTKWQQSYTCTATNNNRGNTSLVIYLLCPLGFTVPAPTLTPNTNKGKFSPPSWIAWPYAGFIWDGYIRWIKYICM